MKKILFLLSAYILGLLLGWYLILPIGVFHLTIFFEEQNLISSSVYYDLKEHFHWYINYKVDKSPNIKHEVIKHNGYITFIKEATFSKTTLWTKEKVYKELTGELVE